MMRLRAGSPGTLFGLGVTTTEELSYSVRNGVVLPDNEATRVAIVTLQDAANRYAATHQVASGAPLALDGRIGNQTRLKVQACLKHLGRTEAVAWTQTVVSLAARVKEATGLLLPGVPAMPSGPIVPTQPTVISPARTSRGPLTARPTSHPTAAPPAGAASTFRNADGSLKPWVVPAGIGAAALLGLLLFSGGSSRRTSSAPA